MMKTQPRVEEPYDARHDTPISWDRAVDCLANAESFWLATTRPDGRPHLVPLFVIWADGRLYFAASPASQKARNLSSKSNAVITTSGNAIDLVVEGEAIRAKDDASLDAAAAAYASKYGWQVEERDGAFHAEGAPTAGPQPYDIYEVTFAKAFAFPTEGTLVPTRWRF